jgi:hypothetical protein
MGNAKAGLKLGLYIGLLIISLCNFTWMQFMYQSRAADEEYIAYVRDIYDIETVDMERMERIAKTLHESAASLACSVVSSIWCLVALAIHVPVLAGRSELLPASMLFPVELIVNILVWVWILVVTAMSTKDFFIATDYSCSTDFLSCYAIFGWLMFVFIALLMMALLLPTGATRAAAHHNAVGAE